MRKFLLNLVLNGLAALPLAAAQGVGAFLGAIAYLGSSKYRRLFRQNYLAATTQNQLPKNLWGAIFGSGMLLTDSLWIWRNPQKALNLIEVFNWDIVERAINGDHGLLMMTPHIGGFEIMPRMLAQRHKATILYRPVRQHWLNEVVEAGRTFPNLHFVPTNLYGVRQMTRALTRGEAIGILPDQVPSGGEGVWANFFGRPAYTTTLPAKLANRHKSPIIMFVAKRKPCGAGWVITAKQLPPFPEDSLLAATALNQAIEEAIQVAPEQFIWAYNRFKHPSGAELPPNK